MFGCVVDFQGRILVTVPNAFSDSLFINSVCAHTVFERSADKEWHNPSRTSSDGWGDQLAQTCLVVGNSKTTRTLHQQLKIIYCSMFRLHTVAQEREGKSVRVYEQTQRDMPPPARQNSLNANWPTAYFLSKFANFYIFKFRISVRVLSSC